MGAGASASPRAGQTPSVVEVSFPLAPCSVTRVRVNGGTTVALITDSGGAVRVRELSGRFVLYSDRTPDRLDFEKCVKVAKLGYKFENAEGTADGLVKVIEHAARNLSASGAGFQSVALANHGPAAAADGGFEWAITSGIKLTSAAELKDPQNGVRRVLEALAKATVDGGRVDLFACNLLATEEGKAVLKEIEAATNTNFAASTNKTGNPTQADSDWVMESDGVDVRDLYFGDTGAFDGTFWAARGYRPAQMEPLEKLKLRKQLAGQPGADSWQGHGVWF